MDTRRFYVSQGEDVYGPLEKDQIKNYLDENVFKPEDGVFCQGWQAQVTLRDYFSEWFDGKDAPTERPTTAEPTAAPKEEKKVVKRKLNPRMKQATQGPDAHQREYLLTKKLVSETDVEKIPPFVAESIIKIHKQQLRAGRLMWLAIFLFIWATIAAVAIYLYGTSESYSNTQTNVTQSAPAKPAPKVTNTEVTPEPLPPKPAPVQEQPEISPQPPKPDIEVTTEPPSLAELKGEEPDNMVPTQPEAKEITRGLVDIGQWNQYPIRSKKVFVISRLDNSLRRMLEQQLQLFSKLESQGTDEQVTEYTRRIEELKNRRPNIEELTNLPPNILPVIEDYLNAFDTITYHDIVPKISVYTSDLRSQIESLSTDLSPSKQTLLKATLEEYASKWDRLAGEISLQRSASTHRQEWAQFAENESKIIAERINELAIDSTEIQPDGSFRLEGKGILVARIQTGPYTLYAPEGWQDHPLKFTRPEF